MRIITTPWRRRETEAKNHARHATGHEIQAQQPHQFGASSTGQMGRWMAIECPTIQLSEKSGIFALGIQSSLNIQSLTLLHFASPQKICPMEGVEMTRRFYSGEPSCPVLSSSRPLSVSNTVIMHLGFLRLLHGLLEGRGEGLQICFSIHKPVVVK